MTRFSRLTSKPRLGGGSEVASQLVNEYSSIRRTLGEPSRVKVTQRFLAAFEQPLKGFFGGVCRTAEAQATKAGQVKRKFWREIMLQHQSVRETGAMRRLQGETRQLNPRLATGYLDIRESGDLEWPDR